MTFQIHFIFIILQICIPPEQTSAYIVFAKTRPKPSSFLLQSSTEPITPWMSLHASKSWGLGEVWNGPYFGEVLSPQLCPSPRRLNTAGHSSQFCHHRQGSSEPSGRNIRWTQHFLSCICFHHWLKRTTLILSFKISWVGPLSPLILASLLVLKAPFKILICGQYFRPTWEVEARFQNFTFLQTQVQRGFLTITINKTKSLVCHLITYIQYLAHFQYIELQPLKSNNLLKALGLTKGGSSASCFLRGSFGCQLVTLAPKQSARG